MAAGIIDRVDRTWEPYAASRGFVHRPGRYAWQHMEWPRVEGVIDLVPVTLAIVPLADAVYTSVRATHRTNLEGHVVVTRRGLLGKLAVTLGAEDLASLDEEFDAAYRVAATSAVSMRAILSSNARKEMLALAADRLVGFSDAAPGAAPRVALEFARVIDEPDVLDRALRLVVDIAQMRDPGSPYR